MNPYRLATTLVSTGFLVTLTASVGWAGPSLVNCALTFQGSAQGNPNGGDQALCANGTYTNVEKVTVPTIEVCQANARSRANECGVGSVVLWLTTSFEGSSGTTVKYGQERADPPVIVTLPAPIGGGSPVSPPAAAGAAGTAGSGGAAVERPQPTTPTVSAGASGSSGKSSTSPTASAGAGGEGRGAAGAAGMGAAPMPSDDTKCSLSAGSRPVRGSVGVLVLAFGALVRRRRSAPST